MGLLNKLFGRKPVVVDNDPGTGSYDAYLADLFEELRLRELLDDEDDDANLDLEIEERDDA